MISYEIRNANFLDQYWKQVKRIALNYHNYKKRLKEVITIYYQYIYNFVFILIIIIAMRIIYIQIRLVTSTHNIIQSEQWRAHFTSSKEGAQSKISSLNLFGIFFRHYYYLLANTPANVFRGKCPAVCKINCLMFEAGQYLISA